MITNYEKAIISLIQKASIVDIIVDLRDQFHDAHGSYPNIIRVQAAIFPAFVVELIKHHKIDASKAVQQPFWINGTPVVFDIKSHYEDFAIAYNRSIDKFLVL